MSGEQANLNLMMSEVDRISDGLKMAVGTGDLNYSQVISKDIELISIEKVLENSGVFLTAEVSSDILNAARSKFYMETLGHSIKNWIVIIYRLLVLFGQ